jgi:hypothetical protein
LAPMRVGAILPLPRYAGPMSIEPMSTPIMSGARARPASKAGVGMP